MNKNNILDSLDAGTRALANKQYRDAGRHFLHSAEGLYRSVEKASPAVRGIRLRQADELREQGESLLKRGNTIANNNGNFNYSMQTTTFKDIAGAETLKEEMYQKIIMPMVQTEKAKLFGVKPSSGILMYGPPGTGKTFFAEALAGELNCPFYEVKPEQILGKYHGESEKALAEIFTTAAQHPFSILFFDEVDAILPNADSGQSSNVENSTTNVFLRHATEHKNILIIAATNRPWAVDRRAIRPERFETMIEVPLPDEKGRLAIFNMLAEKYYFDKAINWHSLAKVTAGYSPADIISVVNAAAQAVFMECVKNDCERTITEADLQQTIDKTSPSVTSAQLQQFVAFSQSKQ